MPNLSKVPSISIYNNKQNGKRLDIQKDTIYDSEKFKDEYIIIVINITGIKITNRNQWMRDVT